MTAGAFFLIAAAALVVAHLASTATRVLQDISWHELQAYARRRDRSRFDEIHDESDDVVIGTETLLFLSMAVLVLAVIGGLGRSQLLQDLDVPRFALLVFVGISGFLAAIVWFPNAISEVAGTAFIYHTWKGWRVVSRTLRPLAWGANAAEAILRRVLGVTEEPDDEEALEEEIRTIVAEGQHDGLLDIGTRDMIEGVIELDDGNVADIMTSRSDMDLMPIELDWDGILGYVTQVGRTRIPVYEGQPDDIVGILYVKDLFSELRKPESARLSVREILREQWYVPPTLHLDELLQQFLQTRNHMALVRNEYGAIIGLVTIEDVLEEIVGEIVDESDKEDLGEIQIGDDGKAIVLGRAHVQDINEQLGYDFPEDDEFDTISGFLMHQLGRVPRQGETINWNNLVISVVEASRRRAEVVQIAST